MMASTVHSQNVLVAVMATALQAALIARYKGTAGGISVTADVITVASEPMATVTKHSLSVAHY